MPLRFDKALLCVYVSAGIGFATARVALAQTSGVLVDGVPGGQTFEAAALPAFEHYCFKCHGDKKSKGHLNLQTIGLTPDFAANFKTWEKVITQLEEKEMPPEDEIQPSEAERAKVIAVIRRTLEEFTGRQEGDPGRVALRRLTSAEYAYSIQDLTGLNLGLERTFVSDAVGGEGFSNVGDVQFIQDSTLVRYLEAARQVAEHAIVGAGPLRFYGDTGKSGQELFAAQRIQKIYQEHGFRTSSGEGGKAYGLDRYGKAFYAAWEYEHRRSLGEADRSLESFAKAEGVDGPFVEYLWKRLRDESLSFPGSEIARAWREISRPDEDKALARENARAQCVRLYDYLQTWQTSLAENTGDAEVASVVTETSFHPSLTNGVRVRLSWPAGTVRASFKLALSFVSGKEGGRGAVLWREPTLRFRRTGETVAGAGGNRRARATPLREVVVESTARELRFGEASESGEVIGTNDFVTAPGRSFRVEFTIPDGTTQAELVLNGRLILPDSATIEDCLVRCVVSHQLTEGATAAANGTFAFLLANPKGAGIERLKAGVAQFARAFPQISHREATPADRDPIPAPFNNDYNNPERNEFHATLKYHRDDSFLTDHVLDAATRRELDQAWADLLTSFDYHDIFLRFIAKKYGLGEARLATLSSERIAELPEAPRRYVQSISEQYRSVQRRIADAEPGHVEEALRFARLAWRRPLTDSEEERLRKFYADARREVDHPAAIRALLARILVAPAFLYRIEPIPALVEKAENGRVPLSGWELANRLSYFLWSSIPDAELSLAAASGELGRPEELERQARRMLRHEKARRFAAEFFGQWFGFYRFDGYRGVDTTRFAEFTDALKSAMYDEAVSFFEYIVREDRPPREILFADYGFLNRTLAVHYGADAEGLAEDQLSKVEGAGRFRRGGLLRLGAVLTSTSAPLRTSAVKRGDWVLRRVLGRGVPPPPGDVGSIPPDDVLADGKTVRERLEAHRRDPSCVNCHSRMDPLGFALEHFDSIGRWRETYRDGQRIDASGRLNDGTEIAEFEGLDAYLRANEKLFYKTLCAKLLGYALGRSELVSDQPLLRQMTEAVESGGSFSDLVARIVESPQFRNRRVSEAHSNP